jgi:hypothetical protein
VLPLSILRHGLCHGSERDYGRSPSDTRAHFIPPSPFASVALTALYNFVYYNIFIMSSDGGRGARTRGFPATLPGTNAPTPGAWAKHCCGAKISSEAATRIVRRACGMFEI